MSLQERAMPPTLPLEESSLRVASQADEHGDEHEGVLVVLAPQLHCWLLYEVYGNQVGTEQTFAALI